MPRGGEVILAQKASRLVFLCLLHAGLPCPFASLFMPWWFFLIVGWDLPFSFSAHTLTKDPFYKKHCAGWMLWRPWEGWDTVCTLMHESAWHFLFSYVKTSLFINSPSCHFSSSVGSFSSLFEHVVFFFFFLVLSGSSHLIWSSTFQFFSLVYY